MLNSKNLAIVKEFGDKIEFTIARFHCTRLFDGTGFIPNSDKI